MDLHAHGRSDLAWRFLDAYPWMGESVQPRIAKAYQALGARHLLAMHWGTFKLTDEAVGEPPARLRAWWAAQGLPPDRLWICDLGEARALRRADDDAPPAAT